MLEEENSSMYNWVSNGFQKQKKSRKKKYKYICHPSIMSFFFFFIVLTINYYFCYILLPIDFKYFAPLINFF